MSHIKKYFVLFLLAVLSSVLYAQIDNNWNFQGILYGNNYEQAIGTIYIQKKGEQISIRREFLNDDKDYMLYAANSKISDPSSVLFNETQLISKKIGTKNSICKCDISLNYDESSGYWKGTISSRQCRNMNFKIIGYASVLPFNESNENHYNNYWITELQRNLWKGYPSPQKIKEIRDNFKIFPVYFDYDKFDVRSEYYSKLQEMAMIIDSHSDLRIRITGHTDWDGSNEYNDTLSKDRALAIKNYLISKGIEGNKIEIEYKGKRNPVADNHTDDGKQLNRRVILEFITTTK